MAIIRQYHKDTGITYVYESISYWDEEKKQSRSKRRVIGKIDPETGEVVPTGKRSGRPRKNPETGRAAVQEAGDAGTAELDEEIRRLRLAIGQKDEEIRLLQKENSRLAAVIGKIRRQLSACLDAMGAEVQQGSCHAGAPGQAV